MKRRFVLAVLGLQAVSPLIVWVKRNPSGAFAEKNPLVKPSNNAAMSAM